MKLINTDGVLYRFGGSLNSVFVFDGVDLSDLIRSSLKMDDLYLFDGNRRIGRAEQTVYEKVRRSADDLIYCSVVFDGSCKRYTYIADDETIEAGDDVLVPAGRDNHIETVRVVQVGYFRKEDAPFAVDKTKHILRKCTPEDFRKPEEEQSGRRAAAGAGLTAEKGSFA